MNYTISEIEATSVESCLRPSVESCLRQIPGSVQLHTLSRMRNDKAGWRICRVLSQLGQRSPPINHRSSALVKIIGLSAIVLRNPHICCSGLQFTQTGTHCSRNHSAQWMCSQKQYGFRFYMEKSCCACFLTSSKLRGRYKF